MGRNLKYQYYNAINDPRNLRLGESKHSAKAQGLGSSNRIFSYADRKNLLNFSASFSSWMREVHPNVRMIKDINHSHMQSFLNYKAQTCSNKTLKTYTSYMYKLVRVCNVTYGLHTQATLHVPHGKDFVGRYGVMMDYSDIESLLNSNIPRNAYVAIRLSYGFGCRISELGKLHKDDIAINDDNVSIHIIDSKGRRSRVAVSWDNSPAFRGFLLDLKNGPGHRVFEIKHESINQAVRRAMGSCGLSGKYSKTSIHSIRKAYAQRLFDSYRQSHTMDDSVSYVSRMLGHGAHRDDIAHAYIQNIY